MTKAQTAAALPIGLLAAGAFLGNSAARVVDPLLHVIASDFNTTVPAVSVLIAAFTLPYGLCQIVLGPMGDKFGKLRVILIALCAYAIALLGCALSTGLGTLTLMRIAAGATSAAALVLAMLSPAWQAFILVQLILGLGYYLLHSVLQAQATEMLPNARGTAVASFALALFMGQSLGALAMGALIAHFSYHTAFLLDAAGILALGAWLRLLLRPAP